MHHAELSRTAVTIAALRTEHQRLRTLIAMLPEADALELVDEYRQTRNAIDKLERYRERLMQR